MNLLKEWLCIAQEMCTYTKYQNNNWHFGSDLTKWTVKGAFGTIGIRSFFS